MKKILLFSLFTGLAFADGELAVVENNQMNRTTLTPACPESRNGWYIFADALYWHADVGSADWAFKNTSNNEKRIVGPNHALNFKWNWGFRIGGGANMSYDSWDTNVYYTWFQTENSNAVGVHGHRAKDNFGVCPPFNQGKIKWRIHFSMIDWELGRWYYVGQKLALRPHIGVKGGWIDQKIHEEFKGSPFKFHAGRKNDFWGIGGAGGVNTTWVLWNPDPHRLSLFGDFATALLYGHFNSRHREIEKNSRSDKVSFEFHPSHLSRNLAVPMLQGVFGFCWDVAFNRNRSHFGLKAGYEVQYWFRQNQFLTGEKRIEKVVGYLRASDDLALQGLTFDFRFDF